MRTMRHVALRGTQGYSRVLGCWTASMQQAQWLVQQSIGACMPRGSCIRPPLRDGIKQWRTAHPLLLLCVHAIVRRLAIIEWGRSAEQGARRTFKFTPS